MLEFKTISDFQNYARDFLNKQFDDICWKYLEALLNRNHYLLPKDKNITGLIGLGYSINAEQIEMTTLGDSVPVYMYNFYLYEDEVLIDQINFNYKVSGLKVIDLTEVS